MTLFLQESTYNDKVLLVHFHARRAKLNVSMLLRKMVINGQFNHEVKNKSSIYVEDFRKTNCENNTDDWCCDQHCYVAKQVVNYFDNHTKLVQ